MAWAPQNHRHSPPTTRFLEDGALPISQPRCPWADRRAGLRDRKRRQHCLSSLEDETRPECGRAVPRRAAGCHSAATPTLRARARLTGGVVSRRLSPSTPTPAWPVRPAAVRLPCSLRARTSVGRPAPTENLRLESLAVGHTCERRCGTYACVFSPAPSPARLRRKAPATFTWPAQITGRRLARPTPAPARSSPPRPSARRQ